MCSWRYQYIGAVIHSHIKGIRKVVKQMLDSCAGTCRLSKVLNTAKPAIVANITASVMEEIQCDLITITCKKGLLPSLKHSFRYILTLKDCFSKYCWLFPKKEHPLQIFFLKYFIIYTQTMEQNLLIGS